MFLSMFRSSLHTSLWAGAVVLVVSTGAGYVVLGWGARGVLSGALIGGGLALALSLHLIVRTLDGRTPESRSPELSPQSFERQMVDRAAAAAFSDTISLAILGCIVSFSAGSLQVARWALPIVAVVGGIDFVVRGIVLIRRGADR